MNNVMNALTKTAQKTLQDELKIQWTYTSNAIEGNTISLGDTAFIIEHGLTIKGKSIKEHNEVVGHARAVDLIYALLAKDNIGEEDIFILHKAVQTNVIIDIECPVGAYKVVENGRYVRVNDKSKYQPYPHPSDINYLMRLWFNEFGNIAQKDLTLEESIKRYTRSHIAFTAIHPFFDGNGRLARLLANITMLKEGYLPLIVSNENRQEYIELLSMYNINVDDLNRSSSELVEENRYFDNLFEFFKIEYQSSQRLLDEIKGNV
jgi:Fic family protein